MVQKTLKAFTLIELLIVVAIIAILAAIAVPNFLEAQTRAKVSRVKSDLRTNATALESYYVDNNSYPRCHPFGIALSNNGWDPTANATSADDLPILERLSTPIAYLTSSLVTDPFKLSFRYSAATALALSTSQPVAITAANDSAAKFNSYIYQSWNSQDRTEVADAATVGKPFAWLLHSAGPDSSYHNLGGVLALETDIDGPINLIYDPTNGTISFGSIYRTGGKASAGTNPAYAAGEGLVSAINGSQ